MLKSHASKSMLFQVNCPHGLKEKVHEVPLLIAGHQLHYLGREAKRGDFVIGVRPTL